MNFYRILGVVGLAILVSLWVPMPADATEKKIYTRETTGIIRDINLSERQAIISGYKYYFGSTVYGDASDVRMYGSEFGAFEMLKVGMKVRVRYAEYGHIRYVTVLQELSPLVTDVER